MGRGDARTRPARRLEQEPADRLLRDAGQHGLLRPPRDLQTEGRRDGRGVGGSLVGQIAKIKGCNVVGFAGTDEKCNWLKSIGFDHAFNYKKVGVAESLAKAAPKGVDCYFDNVGGEMSVAVLNAMNTRGRAAICGAISHYNEVGGYSKTTDILPLCIFKELMVEGFLVGRWAGPQWVEGIKAMAGWVASGEIKVRETVVDGFDKMPQALMGLFTGDNTGKMVVKA